MRMFRCPECNFKGCAEEWNNEQSFAVRPHPIQSENMVEYRYRCPACSEIISGEEIWEVTDDEGKSN
jgi:DNA-directed RNA polymerase subunit RPC12/RpoP